MNTIQTAIFALLGLLLAFSFSMAASRYENRKQDVVQEANAIGTAYLRTDLLPEPQRSAAADLFRRYTDVRLELARSDWYAMQHTLAPTHCRMAHRSRARVAEFSRPRASRAWATSARGADLLCGQDQRRLSRRGRSYVVWPGRRAPTYDRRYRP